MALPGKLCASSSISPRRCLAIGAGSCGVDQSRRQSRGDLLRLTRVGVDLLADDLQRHFVNLGLQIGIEIAELAHLAAGLRLIGQGCNEQRRIQIQRQ